LRDGSLSLALLAAFTPEMSEFIEAQAKGYAVTDKRLYLNFACSTPGLRHNEN
jgi:hypothetical protein